MKIKLNYFISFLLVTAILISFIPNQNRIKCSTNNPLSIQLADNAIPNNFQIEKRLKNKVPAAADFVKAIYQDFNQTVVNSHRLVKSNAPSILRELSFHKHLISLFSTDT